MFEKMVSSQKVKSPYTLLHVTFTDILVMYGIENSTE